MNAAMERRRSGVRIPMALEVALLHADLDEVFEADSVDLSLGGLSMRAPYLPDVGDRLTCRFMLPARETPVEAETEVVWAQDAGARTGEFGLRFVGLDDETRSALAQIIAEENAYTPPRPKSVAPERIPSGRVSLRLEGVPSPILGTVVQTDGDGITVEQELPFLRLDRKVIVDETGREGVVHAVDLVFDGVTPKLVLDVAYTRAPVVVRATPTMDGEASLRGVPAEDTIPDTSAGRESTHAGFAPVANAPVRRAAVAAAPAGGRRDETVAFETVRGQAVDDEAGLDAAIAQGMTAPAPTEAFGDDDLSELAGLRSGAVRWDEWMAKPRPVVRAALTRMGAVCVAAFAWAMGRVGVLMPEVRRRVVVAARTSARLGREGAIHAQGMVRSRRRTSVAPFASNVTARKRGAVEAAPARRGMGIVLGGGALALGAAAYALWPAAELPGAAGATEAQAAMIPDAIAPAPVAAPTMVAAALPEPATALRSAPPAPGGGRVISLDALPLPPGSTGAARAGGPIPEPTFPTPRENIVLPAIAGVPTVPAAAPVAAPGGAEAGGSQASPLRFGADSVPGGRSFRLRMSQPVEEIRGVAESDGFVVTVPGALSLDRAGPIAEALPFVAQSTVYNRGDHAELTIRFAAGTSPRYRVAGDGSDLVIVLGQ